jgi:26S proteasome regulatory subunit T1
MDPIVSDKQLMQSEQPLQVARCTKIIAPNTENAKYLINVRQVSSLTNLIYQTIPKMDVVILYDENGIDK